MVNEEASSHKIDFSRYRPGIIGVESGYIDTIGDISHFQTRDSLPYLFACLLVGSRRHPCQLIERIEYNCPDRILRSIRKRLALECIPDVYRVVNQCMMCCDSRDMKPPRCMVESHSHKPGGCVVDDVYMVFPQVGHQIPSIDRQQLYPFVYPGRDCRNMHYSYSFFDDICRKASFLGYKKPHRMSLAYEIVSKIYSRSYYAIGLWIENVKPEGNPHWNNPLNSARGMLTELRYSINLILRMERI